MSTLGFQWNVQGDLIKSTMEQAIVSGKRGLVSEEPIGIVNSSFYREGKLPTGECINDFSGETVEGNTILVYENGSFTLINSSN